MPSRLPLVGRQPHMPHVPPPEPSPPAHSPLTSHQAARPHRPLASLGLAWPPLNDSAGGWRAASGKFVKPFSLVVGTAPAIVTATIMAAIWVDRHRNV